MIGRRRRPPAWLLVVALLAAAQVLFWKLQVLDSATDEQTVRVINSDLFNEHYPMVQYGFGRLRSGSLPLWNPYQLCGMPFLAIPHTAVLYPGNFVYLLLDPAWGTEVSLILHILFGGICMWVLGRTLGFSQGGALAGGVTFMWSGWMAANVYNATLLPGICWLPATILAIERVVRGGGLAPYALALAVAFQMLNGATEHLVYNLYAGALFTLFRLAALLRPAGWRRVLGRGVLLLACVATGVLLAAPQLLPTLELVQRAVRSYEPLSLQEITRQGVVAPSRLLDEVLSVGGRAAIGTLPLLGLVLGIDRKRFGDLWLFSLILGLAAFLLVGGGTLLELYYHTPLGGMFRRPVKFLHLFAFAGALMSGIAVTRLDGWCAEAPGASRIWRKPSWLACVALLVAALAWSILHDGLPRYPAIFLALLLVFASARRPWLRRAAVVALLLVQGTSLFLAGEVNLQRPALARERFDSLAELMTDLKRAARHNRVYLSQRFVFQPSLTAKQGVMRGLRVTNDYEPLALRRQQLFFDRVTAKERPFGFFDGYFTLNPESRWNLLDLTSTRFLVLQPGKPEEKFLRDASQATATTGVARVPASLVSYDPHNLRIYRRNRSVPRAYFVTDARVVNGGDAALAALETPDFHPLREVVLESDGEDMPASRGRVVKDAEVKIFVDEPERVVVDVRTNVPGFLVLTDTYYPGWKAYEDAQELPIRRANYLFRAVSVDAGHHIVRFEYEPESFWTGVLVAAVTAAAMLAAFAWSVRGRLRGTGRHREASRDEAGSL